MTDANTKLARQCVKRGAAFLDERDPKWFRCIDLAKFKISSRTSCVIGQVYLEPFSKAIGLLGIGGWSNEPTRFGFVSAWDGADYDSLQVAWYNLIRRRQLANGGLRVS